jgi:hypothetical protein
LSCCSLPRLRKRYVHTHTHTHTHTNTQTNTSTKHKHPNTNTHSHSRARTHIHTHTRTHAQTETQTLMRTQTHTHTHRRTNAPPCCCCCRCSRSRYPCAKTSRIRTLSSKLAQSCLLLIEEIAFNSQSQFLCRAGVLRRSQVRLIWQQHRVIGTLQEAAVWGVMEDQRMQRRCRQWLLSLYVVHLVQHACACLLHIPVWPDSSVA